MAAKLIKIAKQMSPDASHAERWVYVAASMEAHGVFVGTDVDGSDDYPSAFDASDQPGVDAELLVLPRHQTMFENEGLRPKEPGSLQVLAQEVVGLNRMINVRHQAGPSPVTAICDDCYVTLEMGPPFEFPCQSRVLLPSLMAWPNDNRSADSIDDDFLPLPSSVKEVLNESDHRNAKPLNSVSTHRD